MAEPDALLRHLSSLGGPALRRACRAVLGPGEHGERALAARLADPATLSALLAQAGPVAARLLSAVVDAGVPVRRADVTGLAPGGGELLEHLEERALVASLKHGPGMPAHVTVAPGLAGPLAACLAVPEPPAPAADGAARAGAQRRFELALLVAAVARVRPRLTHHGRLHRTDRAALGELLGPLGRGADAIEDEIAALVDEGALAPHGGHLAPVPAVAGDVRGLRLRRALAQVCAPALPDPALAIAARLLAGGGVLSVRRVLAEAQAALLRARAALPDEEAKALRPARAELLETLSALLALDAVAVLDEKGHAAPPAEGHALQKAAAGEALFLAADPDVAACLRGERVRHHARGRGHVQSSFEVVADEACEPDVVAKVGLFATLLRADRAAVLRLEPASVARAAGWGVGPEAMLHALHALAGRGVPDTVERAVLDWAARARPGPAPQPIAPPRSPDALRDEARARLAQAGAERLAGAR